MSDEATSGLGVKDSQSFQMRFQPPMKSARLKLGVCCLGARGWSVRRLLGTLLRRSALGFAMKELATVPAEGPTPLVFTETVEVGVSLATIELAGSKEVIKGFQNCIVEKSQEIQKAPKSS